MVKSDNNYNVSFAKLEAKVEMMSDKLNKLDEIDNTLKDIQKCMSANHTDVALLAKDVDSIAEKCRLLDCRVSKLEEKDIEMDKTLNILTLKVASITAIASFIGWLIINFFQK